MDRAPAEKPSTSCNVENNIVTYIVHVANNLTELDDHFSLKVRASREGKQDSEYLGFSRMLRYCKSLW
jgi:hypothetical protein